jgi:hypothetical protein
LETITTALKLLESATAAGTVETMSGGYTLNTDVHPTIRL